MKKIYSFEYAIKNHPDVEGKIMLDQMRSIDKSRLGKKVGSFSVREMQEIDIITKFVLGIQ